MKASVDNRSGLPSDPVRRVVWGVLDSLDVNHWWLVVRVYQTDWWHHHGHFYALDDWALITARVPLLPEDAHDRKLRGGPGPIAPRNWQEALGCIVAHESTHFRQYLNRNGSPPYLRKPAVAHWRRTSSGHTWVKGQTKPVEVRRPTFKEVDAEWAEAVFLERWRSPWKEKIMSGRNEYAIIIDDSYDAILLRDLLRDAAQKAHTRAGKASQRRALDRNLKQFECFARYAERFEHVRKEEAARITERLGPK